MTVATRPNMHSNPKDRLGRKYAVQLNRRSGRRRTAIVGCDGERIAEVLYSSSRLADAVASVLAVGAFFLPFAAIVAFFGNLPDFVQRLLNPLHVEASPLWAWGVVVSALASLAYLLSLLVLLWTHARVRIQAGPMTQEDEVDISIVEQRSILPWKVTAVVAIDGRELGVIRGLGRSLLSFRGNDRLAVEFASVEDWRRDRETALSALLVLIGMLFNIIAVPTRQRMTQQWSIQESERAVGWIGYHRNAPEQYQVLLEEGTEHYTLTILAVALFLARPASSGNVESHEEIHERI